MYRACERRLTLRDPQPTSTPVKTATAPAATKTTKPATTFTSNKRGLGYNDAALTLAFSNKKAISWVYNCERLRLTSDGSLPTS